MSHAHHDHSHDHNHDHDHSHGHTHGHHSMGIIGTIGAALHLPGFGHDHDHGYTELAADNALRDNKLGVRTVWLALLALAITTVLQIAIYIASNSVALLADTVHNLGDALNSIPLLIAFYLARRVATRRYTYGFGRAEDVAGILIVISIAFSAVDYVAPVFTLCCISSRNLEGYFMPLVEGLLRGCWGVVEGLFGGC